MKKFFRLPVALISALLLYLPLFNKAAPAQQTLIANQQTKEAIAKIEKTNPLILQHANTLFQEGDLQIFAAHSSHSSHRSHSSHSSHASHRSAVHSSHFSSTYEAPAPKTVAPTKCYTLGSTKREVLDIQGKPSGITGETWFYDMSYIIFNDGLVSGYNDSSNNLKIEIKL